MMQPQSFFQLSLHQLGAIAFLGFVAVISPASARAQTAPVACPAAMVSVYFAHGDAAASPQSEALIGRVGEAVTSCAPDTVYLLAHVDIGEGEGALSLALKRLERIGRELVARGLPADRIRTATGLPPKNTASMALRQVDILVNGAPSTKADEPPLSRARLMRPHDV